MRTLLWLPCAVLLAGLPARAESKLDHWTVVGLRAPDEGSMRDEVATLRGALSLELSARGSGVVRDEDATRLRLGMAGADLRAVRDRIDAAELYYFQLELEIARANLEQALAELAHASGIPEAWTYTRTARMLLGMIHLAGRDAAGRERAEREFAAVARLQPDWSPAKASYPAEVIELFAEARRRVQATERGLLRVACEPACTGGHVFVDTYPVALPGAAASLPPGRYGVVVTDRFERPQLRSLLHTVDVRAGEESRLQVDLEVEGRLVAAEGPVLIAPAEPAERRRAAALLARRVDADFTLVLHRGEAGAWNAWIVGRNGAISRELSVPAEEADPLPALAQLAVGEGVTGTDTAVASLEAPAALHLSAASVERPVAQGSSPDLWTASRWGSAGGAVVAGALGLFLRLDAGQRDDALHAQLSARGGVLSSERAARAARSEADGIATERGWGNGLLIGAGVLTATAVTLYLLDRGGDAEPVVRW